MQQISGDIEDYAFYNHDNMNDYEIKKFIKEGYRLHNELREFRVQIHKLLKEKGKGDERWKNQ